MNLDVFFIFLFGLCWGSFLNVVAFRLVVGKSFFSPRSRCPKCDCFISWYDNIPLISWILLKGRCRKCKAIISFLYPIIELLTAFLIVFLYKKYFLDYSDLYYYIANQDLKFPDLISGFSYKNCLSFIVYFIFLSGLIVAIRTDLQKMVIPQVCSLWLVPVGFVSSYFNFTKITVWESLVGAFLGYAFLWIIAFLFKTFSGRDGVGIGDMELLAMIGSFIGPIGVWISLMIGSISGLIIGSFYLFLLKKNRLMRIPFGPFLALGSILYFFFDQKIIQFLFR